MRKRFLEGFHYDAHPMGMLVSAIAALSTFYPEANDIHDPDNRYKQIVRLIAKMPTLAAACHRFSVGMPFVYPDNSLGLQRELPVDDVEGRRASLRRQPGARPRPRRAVHPPRRPRAELRHHRDAHGRRRPTPTPTCAPPRRPPPSTARATAAPTRHVIHMLTEIGSIDKVPAFIEVGEGRQGPHARASATASYKSYDPRATIIKQTADEVFAITGKNPLLDIALELEEVALSDDYFISRKLYPNVDFYSGLIYQAMGFPIEMFTVLFAIPRTAGWLAHWVELLEQDQRIARPRQLYTGTGGPRLRRPSATGSRPPHARGHDRRRRARVAGAPGPRAGRRRGRAWRCGPPASATPTCSSAPGFYPPPPGAPADIPGLEAAGEVVAARARAPPASRSAIG